MVSSAWSGTGGGSGSRCFPPPPSRSGVGRGLRVFLPARHPEREVEHPALVALDEDGEGAAVPREEPPDQVLVAVGGLTHRRPPRRRTPPPLPGCRPRWRPPRGSPAARTDPSPPPR